MEKSGMTKEEKHSTEVITLGEPMAVYIAEEPGDLRNAKRYSRAAAGAELNVAVGLSRLGHKVSYLTKLGRDPYGQMIFDFLNKEGVGTDHVLWDETRLTGSYLKARVEEGDPDIFYYRKNSAASTYHSADVRTGFEEGKILHITGISAGVSALMRDALQEAVHLAKERGMLITFDTNLRPALWRTQEEMIQTVNGFAFQSDIVMPGFGEAQILTGEQELGKIGQFYFDRGVKIVIVKLGAAGACLLEPGEYRSIQGFHTENIVDTVGAGDAFAAGVISGILEGTSMEEAVRRGNAMGAMIISSPGDNDGLPYKDELRAFLKRAGSIEKK